MPTLFVIAGPNGCGKSILTRTTWFDGIDLIDPDAMAQSLMTGTPGQAAREALRRRQEAIRAGRSHLVETTLSGTGIIRHMKLARKESYRVELHFISLDSSDQALGRIRNRVELGGHDVPEADVRRRFVRSYANLPAAILESDEVHFYDNTDPDQPHREVGIIRQGIWSNTPHPPAWVMKAFFGVKALTANPDPQAR